VCKNINLKQFIPNRFAISNIICTFVAIRTDNSMTTEHLYFITFCVGSLSEALHKSAAQVYSALRSSGVLNEYIIPCYDVLHTFSKEYIVQDLTEVLKEKGALA
jgi:hypothetical protein